MMMKVRYFFLTLFILMTFVFKQSFAMEMEDYDIAVLGALNKVTGKNSVIKSEVGEKIKFGDLEIKVFACQKSSPLEAPESASFLRIKNKDRLEFSGWMYASSPALSAMESGVYDIWVVDCEKNTCKNGKDCL